jgi:N-acetylglucosamine kinase-like BadF-type ATPase
METNSTTYLGIDGGGTRCRARIEDENGRVLGEASSGPATTRAIGDLLDLFLARGIDRLSLVGGLADAIMPWLTPDLRARLRHPDADAAAGALLVARGRLDLPKRETDHEQASKFRV